MEYQQETLPTDKVFTVSASGVALRCRRFGGKGAPILMIHGACVDSEFFAKTARVLAEWHRVILYDRRGYGQSTGTENLDCSAAIQAEDAAAVLRTAGEPCHVVAHSAGTVIAMELAVRHPELVRSLLLHEPVATGYAPAEGEYRRTLDEINRLIAQGRYTRALTQFMPFIGQRDLRAAEPTPAEQKYAGRNARSFIRGEFSAFFAYPPDTERLSKLPVTIGVGELSQGTARWDMAVGLAHELNASLLYFPGAHNCARDFPREFAYLTAGTLNN